MHSFTKYITLVFLLAMTVFLSSCEEDYVLTRSAFKPSVVVNSIFTIGKPWVVNLTFSRDQLVNESKITEISNANAYIIEKSNGREIPLTYIGNGNYESKIFPPEGDKTYELVVEVPGYAAVKASSKATRNTTLYNINSSTTYFDGQGATRIDFEIRDNYQNFYIWNLVTENANIRIDTNYSGNPKNLLNSILRFNDVSKLIGSISTPNNNDAVSSGEEFSTIKAESTFRNTTINDVNQKTKKYLRFLTVSQDLYHYYKSVEEFNTAENHNSSISHTPKVHSNITNGLGLFAGFSERFIEIK